VLAVKSSQARETRFVSKSLHGINEVVARDAALGCNDFWSLRRKGLRRVTRGRSNDEMSLHRG